MNSPINEPFRAVIVGMIGTTMLATVILYAVTGWLWLVVHEGLH